MPDYYAKYLRGAANIDSYVAISPIWHRSNLGGLSMIADTAGVLGLQAGAYAALAPAAASAPEFLPDSPFVAALHAGGTARVGSISYTNIVTADDELVKPYSSGLEPDMTNVIVQQVCPLDHSDHFELAADPIAMTLVLNALDPANPRPVTCQLVLPLTGPLG